jgi:hypothetical protein
MTKRLKQFIMIFSAVLFGIVVGAYSQTFGAKLAKLSEEKAEITKMDLVLMNTRIGGILIDELAVPIVPTSFTYDSKNQKIVTTAFVNPAFLSKSNPAQLSKVLDSHATSLCLAPLESEGNFATVFGLTMAPRAYCVVHFFTRSPDVAGYAIAREVAKYMDGKLSLE